MTICEAELHIVDDRQQKRVVLTCQLELGHVGQHIETCPQDDRIENSPVEVRWSLDDRDHDPGTSRHWTWKNLA